VLRTIRDACEYMTGIGKKRELRDRWQRVRKLILAKVDAQTESRKRPDPPLLTTGRALP
jgi:hypothetical protein